MPRMKISTPIASSTSRSVAACSAAYRPPAASTSASVTGIAVIMHATTSGRPRRSAERGELDGERLPEGRQPRRVLGVERRQVRRIGERQHRHLAAVGEVDEAIRLEVGREERLADEVDVGDDRARKVGLVRPMGAHALEVRREPLGPARREVAVRKDPSAVYATEAKSSAEGVALKGGEELARPREARAGVERHRVCRRCRSAPSPPGAARPPRGTRSQCSGQERSDTRSVVAFLQASPVHLERMGKAAPRTSRVMRGLL